MTFDTTPVGIAVACVGVTTDNLGQCMQSLAHIEFLREDGEEASLTVKYIRSKKWLTGVGVSLFGNIVTAIGLAMSPQTLFGALGSLGISINVFTSYIILKERPTRLILFGTIIIIAASALAVYSGFQAEPSTGLDISDLHSKAISMEFLIYLVALLCLIIGIQCSLIGPPLICHHKPPGWLDYGYPVIAAVLGSFVYLSDFSYFKMSRSRW